MVRTQRKADTETSLEASVRHALRNCHVSELGYLGNGSYSTAKIVGILEFVYEVPFVRHARGISPYNKSTSHLNLSFCG